ncbi:unnamed protein product [Mucor hiemalis]
MSTLVTRVLSHTDKIPMMNNASSWIPYLNKKEEVLEQQQQQQPTEDENFNAYRRLQPPGSPRYSMAPPSYEAATKNTTTPIIIENKRFSTLTTMWKRASFSSSTHSTDIKTPLASPTTIDKKQMDHAVTLINVATDMNNSGNQQMAIDLYMMGLDKMMSALPLESDPTVKAALERKLIEIKERHQLSLVSLDDIIKDPEQQDEEEKNNPLRAQISNLVINAAVLSAVALKKSPIPDAFSSVMNFAVDGIQNMDEKHQIRKRTWDLAATSVAKAVEIDRQFEIHQMVTGAVYTGIAAFVKAGLAYAETPGHNIPSSSATTTK